MVRVQCECRTPMSAGTSRSRPDGYILPRLAPVVMEKLNSMVTYSRTQGPYAQAESTKSIGTASESTQSHHDGQRVRRPTGPDTGDRHFFHFFHSLRHRGQTLFSFLATILFLFGLDHQNLTYRYSDCDVRLTNVEGKVVKETLA